jgi:crossover junction endodeoxyribonuclease RuvC
VRIFGVDPGIARTGFGVIEDSNPPTCHTYGVIETDSGSSVAERLLVLFSRLEHLIDEWSPDVAAVEELFFARNVSSAIVVGQARGVALLALARRGLPVSEYKPSEVKLAITGHGRADKEQIQAMVTLLLGLNAVPHPDDAADALAVALCHAQTSAFLSRICEAT